jgi:hypothetical protein
LVSKTVLSMNRSADLLIGSFPNRASDEPIRRSALRRVQEFKARIGIRRHLTPARSSEERGNRSPRYFKFHYSIGGANRPPAALPGIET